MTTDTALITLLTAVVNPVVTIDSNSLLAPKRHQAAVFRSFRAAQLSTAKHVIAQLRASHPHLQAALDELLEAGEKQP